MSQPLINSLGHRIGARGGRTRNALMAALRDLLQDRHMAEIKVADVAARAGLSPTNFYTYFKSLEEAALALCEAPSADCAGLATHLDADWSADGAFSSARALTLAMLAVWEQHGPVLRIEHGLADRGDAAFADSRIRRLRRLHLALERRIAQAQAQGYHPAGLSPRLASYEVAAMIESMARAFQLLRRADTDDAILDTTAHMVARLVTGR